MPTPMKIGAGMRLSQVSRHAVLSSRARRESRMLRIVISQHVRYSLELTRRAAWARRARRCMATCCGAGKGQRSKRGAGLGNAGLPAGYNASTRGVSWSSMTKEPSFSPAMRALSLPSSSNRCRRGTTGIRPSTHPRAYCPLSFETLNKFEFRNREGTDDGMGGPHYVHGAALGA